MSLIKRAIQYTRPYRFSFGIAILCNLLYAIFNVLALAFMMPILSILFEEQADIILEKPVFSGNLMELKDFGTDYANYYMNILTEQEGPIQVLLYSCIAFIVLFFFRNIFSYFSEFFLIDFCLGVSSYFIIYFINNILIFYVFSFFDI